ncbi:MAG: nitrite/sulfite reductase, partial [Rhodobacteraceae bacterium]|nr:nitrite/sulfite reductase [Paracoccaceae bacterium]
LIRQWSTDHPEFAYLPRKFKLAVTGTEDDRAVIRFHDIGIRVREQDGEIGYQIVIGGGLGRTPMVGKVVREFLPRADLFAYLEAILKVYNLSGRRDNKYKARIKILVHETGLETLKARIEAEFATQKRLLPDLNPEVVNHVRQGFVEPAYIETDFDPNTAQSPAFRAFLDTNTRAHKRPDHASVTVSIKPIGGTPGDATSDQMRTLAEIAETYGYDELRISHEQNVILPHVHRANLPAVYAALRDAGLATANVGLISDIIACPGMDYCALATARSIPIAQQIGEAFADLDAQHDIGPLKIKISGCINACGHHHVGHIGILGLDRAGVENYQITLGGDGTEEATLGTRTGPGFAYDEIVPAVERLIEAYLDQRLSPEETFLAAYRRLGLTPFKAALYGDGHAKAA